MRLAAELLATRTRRVPVVFNFSTWDPTITSLLAWLAARLIEDHPSLKGPAPDSGGATLAATLLAEGWILPILDHLPGHPPAPPQHPRPGLVATT